MRPVVRITILAMAVAALAAPAVALPATAAVTPAAVTDYCGAQGTQTTGSQGGERHCNGYYQETPDQSNLPVSLAWQVYLPDPTIWGPGPYPTVLDYSGYEPATTFFDGLKGAFISQGYAVAGANIRGTGCSGGQFDYFEQTEWKDGVDIVNFLGTQPWSNGRVAMVGKSYPGITPLYVAAVSGDPADPGNHLKAIVPGSFFADLYRDVAYPGGIQNTVFAAGWSLGSQPANQFDQQSSGVDSGDPQCIQNQAERPANETSNPFMNLQENPYDDTLYHERSDIYFAHQVQVPVFTELAWQDEEVGANGMDYLTQLPKQTPWRAVALNGDHGEYYGSSILPQIYRFLSYYLKQQVPAGDACAGSGDGTFAAALACYQAEPRLTVEGDVNDHQQPSYTLHFPTWPATNDVDRFYLHNGGTLTTHAPTTTEPGTTYNYVPGVGSNSYGTLQGFQGNIPADNDFWQQQPPAGTVAQFTTAPFTSDTLYTGTASLDLWLSSTAPDTDLEVMLTELHPDGHGGWIEQYVQKGWLRASHRKEDPAKSTPLRPYQTHLLGDVQPLTPSTATPMRVEIFPFSQVFRAGTRLRVTVEAPALAPELWGFAALPTPAQNTIYTDPGHPSSLALPLVLDADGATFPAEPDCTQDNNHFIANQPCRPATGALPGPAVPESPLPIALVLVGLLTTTAVLAVRRRSLRNG